jgi:chromosome segregation ATPase
MTTLNQTLECLIEGIGQQTGEAIRTEINNLLAMPNVDLTALQSAIAAIQSLLDADPSTEGFQTGQNIITQLVALGNRLDALENSTVVAQLQVLVNSLNTALTAETTAREAGDATLQAALDALTAQYDTLSQQVSTVINNPGGDSGCDCAAIAAQITTLETAIANLQGVDAAQAAQIAALQTQVANLSGSLAAAVSDAAAALTAAQAAQATATANATAVAALQTAVNTLDSRETERHNGHGNRLNDLENFRGGIEAIDCTALLAKHALGLSAGLAASGY